MRVQTQFRPGTDLIEIWIWRDAPDGHRYRFDLTAEGFTWTQEQEGSTVEPSLTLGSEVFKALMAEGSEILPPSAAQARHLEDAIKVRDRLFALVERPNA